MTVYLDLLIRVRLRLITQIDTSAAIGVAAGNGRNPATRIKVLC